jgi:ribonuclease HIII
MRSERRVIGVDESGKGDFFGPLVVAAFLAPDSAVPDLQAAGVRDGKLIANKKLLTIDERLRAVYPHAVVVIGPEEYNRRYKQIKNLNKLLAEGHARAVSVLLRENQADVAVSDKFGKAELVEQALAREEVSVPIEQLVRGEAIPQVAAASILARAAFMRESDQMSQSLGYDLPRGAGSIVDDAGRIIARRWPELSFAKIAKVHFKNMRRITHPTLFSR